METIKKRHNPEITPEDLAAKAFDKLENIVQEAKNSPNNEVEKTDNALREDLYNLISKVFGEEFYKENKELFVGFSGGSPNPNKIRYPEILKHFEGGENSVTLFKTGKTKWYQRKNTEKYITFDVDLPVTKIKTDQGEVLQFTSVVENGKYNPIKITAHTTEALKEAKIFGKAYETLTGQKARIIQDCADALEQKVDVEQHNFKNEALKNMGSKTFQFGNGFFQGFFAAPTAIQKNANNTINSFEKGLLGGALTSVVGGGFFYALTGVLCVDSSVRAKIMDNHLWVIPEIHISTNALSGLKAWYNHETKKAEEEYNKGKK